MAGSATAEARGRCTWRGRERRMVSKRNGVSKMLVQCILQAALVVLLVLVVITCRDFSFDAQESGDGVNSRWTLEVGFSFIYLSNACQR